MDSYGVLVFHDQDITDEQQIAFSTVLGPLEVKKRPGTSARRRRAGWARASAISPTSTRTARSSRPTTASGSSSWATGCGTPTAPHGRRRPSIRFCPPGRSRRGAAAPSSPTCARPTTRWTTRTKAEVEDLICEHSLLHSRGAIGFSEFTPEEVELFRPVLQRLVRIHPSSGRKSLFLSSHAGTIVGWTIPEARSFLRDLTEHATQREFVYSHSWRQHDLVMWDNRSTMHRARRFDRTEVRDMRRTTLAGDAPTVEQVDA